MEKQSRYLRNSRNQLGSSVRGDCTSLLDIGIVGIECTFESCGKVIAESKPVEVAAHANGRGSAG